MNLNPTLACVTAAFTAALGLAVLLRKRHSAASWSFTGGMVLLAVETLFNGFSFNELAPKNAGFLQGAAFVTRSFLPGVWLFFSLTYSRGNYRESLARWRFLLLAAFVLPVALAVAFRGELVQVLPFPQPGAGFWFRLGGQPAKALNVLCLSSCPDCGAFWRSGKLSARSLSRVTWPGYFGRAPPLQPSPAKYTAFYQPPFRKAPA